MCVCVCADWLTWSHFLSGTSPVCSLWGHPVWGRTAAPTVWPWLLGLWSDGTLYREPRRGSNLNREVFVLMWKKLRRWSEKKICTLPFPGEMCQKILRQHTRNKHRKHLCNDLYANNSLCYSYINVSYILKDKCTQNSRKQLLNWCRYTYTFPPPGEIL